MSDKHEIAKAIAEAIIQAARYANRDANEYSVQTFKNTKISGNQIRQGSIPGFMLKDGSIPSIKIKELDADIARIALAQIQTAEIEYAQIKNVNITTADIKNANIDYARVKDLDADSAYFNTEVFQLGVGGELYIGRLRVRAANIDFLQVGQLVLEDDDGNLHAIGVDADGNMTTKPYEVQYQNISDKAKGLMSEYTIFRGATPPSTPYVGQLWVNTTTEIISRCTQTQPTVKWEPVKASELHTSFIEAVEKGLNILSTGEINILGGGNLNIKSGGNLNVDAMGSVKVASGGKIELASADDLVLNSATGVTVGGYVTNEVSSAVSGFQTQIDGKIDTYFGTNDPSLGWTSAQKAAAVGDMWYNSTAKKLKRWNGASWDDINDQTAIDAYAKADTAQDTADGKRRVFVSQPVPPYDVGDLWTGGSTGDLKRCSTPKASGGSYSAGDWVLATKYTDDSALTNFVNNTYTPAISVKNRIWYQPGVPTSSAVNDIWYDTDANPVKIYRANAANVSAIVTSGNGWYDITSVALDQALKGLNSLGNGSYHFFQSSTRPKSAGESDGSQINIGDIWLYTGTSGTKYVNGATYRAVSTNPTTDSGWLAFVAGAVLTPHITLNANHLTLSGESDLTIANPLGGNAITMNKDGLAIESGSDLTIKDGSGGNVINMDSTGLTLSSTGQLKLQSTNSIKIGGSPFSVGGTNLRPESTPMSSWNLTVSQQTNNYGLYKGGKSWRVSNRTGWPAYIRLSYGMSFKEGVTYTASFYGYLSASDNITDLIYHDSAHPRASQTAWTVKDLGLGFYRFSFSFVPSWTGDGGEGVLAYADNLSAGQQFWISGIQIEEGNMATDWSPSPSDPASGVKTASITIGDGGIDLTASDKITVNGGEFIATKANSITNEATNSIVSTVKNDSDWLGKGTAASTYSTITQTNNSINLAVSEVQVGGANLIRNSGNFQNVEGWTVWSTGGGETVEVVTSSTLNRNVLQVSNIDEDAYLHSPVINETLIGESEYIIQFISNVVAPLSVRVGDTNVTNTSLDFGVLYQGPYVGGGYYLYTGKATCTGIQNVPRLQIVIREKTGAYGFDRFKLEKANKRSEWTPAPDDPASSVKTSSVEVNTNGIYMDTTGDFSLNAGVNVNIRGGSGTSEVGLSNSPSLPFLWAGGTSSTAPFRVQRDGSVIATKIQHEMPYTFWDMADSSTPAEFSVYIPVGYTIDSVTFTFQTKKARTFAKATVGGSGETGTSSGSTGLTANPGSGTGGTIYTGYESSHTHTVYVPAPSATYTTSGGSTHRHSIAEHTHPSDGGNHSHSLANHVHAVGGHTHGINYGINEKSTLATSCALKVGDTTIGTYSPNPSNPVELKARMSAGWNTITVAPNNDARIVAFALVKLTPA